VAILAFEEDAWLGFAAGFSGLVDCKDNDRPGMTYDITASANAARFLYFVGSNAKDRTLIADARRDNDCRI
jgi:hypothetical protein